MRYGCKVDANQGAIVAELRKIGYSVRSTATIGKGFPDVCVGSNGRNYLFEIKDPAKPPSARELTPDELEFFSIWNGQVNLVTTSEQIHEIIERREGVRK